MLAQSMSDFDTFRIIAETVTPLAGIVGLGWWLRSQFSDTKKELYEAYEQHEKQDQSRHEDNLREFAKVFVALAELGWRNGKRVQ